MNLNEIFGMRFVVTHHNGRNLMELEAEEWGNFYKKLRKEMLTHPDFSYVHMFDNGDGYIVAEGSLRRTLKFTESSGKQEMETAIGDFVQELEGYFNANMTLEALEITTLT